LNRHNSTRHEVRARAASEERQKAIARNVERSKRLVALIGGNMDRGCDLAPMSSVDLLMGKDLWQVELDARLLHLID
jgi:hypothetical protein